MRRTVALLAGILWLGSFSDGSAQGSPNVVAGAMVTASARVLSPLEVRQLGAFVGEEEGNGLSVSSELGIAGRLPFVMAAHVHPAPVKNRWAPQQGIWSLQREAEPVTTPEVEPDESSAVPVSRHSVVVPSTGGTVLVTWFVSVAL